MDIDYSVYLVTDQFDFTESEFLNIIEEALKGNTTIVQIREKNSSTRDFLNLAQKVKKLTDKYNVPLIINDRIDIALAVDSAGVHLGQDDMPCKIARKIIGPDKIIGISAENYGDALQAQEDGADYLGIGAIEKTPTKTDCSVISEEDLNKIKKTIKIPHVAIGGVKEHNTREIIDKYGFDGVAIVSAIMKSDLPKEAATNFYNLVNSKLTLDDVYAAIYGVIVGDALGVPYEFKSRSTLQKTPVTGMRGHGTYDKPEGTWSDDSSLTLALADSLAYGIDYDDIMSRFSKWLYQNMYTPENEVFDVGQTTEEAIYNYTMGVNPLDCGGVEEYENGNGSLMRIMPLLLYINRKSIDAKSAIELINNVSSLTHAHKTSKACCNIYNFLVQAIIENKKADNLKTLIKKAIERAKKQYPLKEYPEFKSLYDDLFFDSGENLDSTGYVVNALQIAFYACYHSSDYSDAVLCAVNFGEDTDTNAAITGGIAALYYGYKSIPPKWIDVIINKELINEVLDAFSEGLKYY